MPNLETPSFNETVVLKHPVQFGTEKITQLEFRRRLKARDFFGIRISGMQFDDYATLISRACNVAAPILEELDAEDFTKACAVINAFLSSGPETGKTV